MQSEERSTSQSILKLVHRSQGSAIRRAGRSIVFSSIRAGKVRRPCFSHGRVWHRQVGDTINWLKVLRRLASDLFWLLAHHDPTVLLGCVLANACENQRACVARIRLQDPCLVLADAAGRGLPRYVFLRRIETKWHGPSGQVEVRNRRTFGSVSSLGEGGLYFGTVGRRAVSAYRLRTARSW